MLRTEVNQKECSHQCLFCCLVHRVIGKLSRENQSWITKWLKIRQEKAPSLLIFRDKSLSFNSLQLKSAGMCVPPRSLVRNACLGFHLSPTEADSACKQDLQVKGLLITFQKHCPRRRRWHPTPVLLPGKSHGWRSLVGCSPWGR